MKHQAFLLRSMRKKQGFTQQQFSDLCGYDCRQIISNIERGLSYPSKRVLKQMKRFCKMKEISDAIKFDHANMANKLIGEIYGDQ